MEWVIQTADLGVTAGDDNDPGVDCGAFGDGECELGDALFTEANAMNRDCQLSGLTFYSWARRFDVANPPQKQT
jgi:hypothetical protein